MCLAEALLRVPDTATMDDLIEDKIAPARWLEHFDAGNPPLVNVSTLALTLTGEVLQRRRRRHRRAPCKASCSGWASR